MKEPDQTGACGCGRVRYRFSAPSTWCAHVHHRGVQRAHGAAVVTFTAVRFDRLEILEGESALTDWAGFPLGTRRFCRECGTPVFVTNDESPEQILVATATLDGEPGRRPAANLYVDQAASWGPIADQLPGFGGERGSEPLGITALRDRVNRVEPGVRLATVWDRFDLLELYAAHLADDGWPASPTLEVGLERTLERADHWIVVAEGDSGTLAGFVELCISWDVERGKQCVTPLREFVREPMAVETTRRRDRLVEYLAAEVARG